MSLLPKDIFSLENANNFVCKMGSYMTNDVHSLMALRISLLGEMQSVFTVQFTSVRYYSGPIMWVGANFQIAPYNECLKLLRKMHGFENYPTEEEARASGLIMRDDYYKLYVAGSSDFEVKIIAKHSNIIELEKPSRA